MTSTSRVMCGAALIVGMLCSTTLRAAADGVGPPVASAPGSANVANVVPAVSVDDVDVTEDGLEVNRQTFSKNDGKVVVKFRLTAELHGTATVEWRTVDGSAVAGEHYVAASGTFTMRPGRLVYSTKVVLASNDVAPEPDRSFDVEIVGISGPLTIADGEATVTIRDDDHTPTLSVIGAFAVVEGDDDHVLEFTLTLDHPSEKIVLIWVGAFDGTATGGQRYASGFDFVNFHNQKRNTSVLQRIYPGDTTKTVFVTIKGDLTTEDDETFDLRLHHGHRGVLPILPDPSELTVTILNDD